jgi:hypothetical protein
VIINKNHQQAQAKKLYINRATIGGFADDDYWSSSEYNWSDAWIQLFYIAYLSNTKTNNLRVRAVRSF